MTIKSFRNKLKMYNSKHSNCHVVLRMFGVSSHVVCLVLLDTKRPYAWYETKLSTYPGMAYVYKHKNEPKELENLWVKFCFTPFDKWGIKFNKNKWVTVDG